MIILCVLVNYVPFVLGGDFFSGGLHYIFSIKFM